MSVAELSIEEGLTALLAGDPRITRDPYAFYGRLRERAAVHRHGSLVYVATYAGVASAFRDSQRLANAQGSTPGADGALSLLSAEERQSYDDLLEFELGYMSRVDGVTHLRIRSAVRSAFTPAGVAALGSRVQQFTDELLDELREQEPAELVELAYRLPSLVIMSMLGAPGEDADLLKGWGDAISRRRRRMPVQPELIREATIALAQLKAYVGDLVERSRRTPGSHLLAALLEAESGERLTRDEVVATCLLLLLAGHETTTSLIGNGVLALLEHPDQWKLLCANPSLAPGAVEESLRYDPPVQISLRYAAVDLELDGVQVPIGTPVWLLIGSANRDAQAFTNPGAMDITRRPNEHLGLGRGVHFCLGGPLARLQGRIVFTTLARRYPGLELVADGQGLPRSTHPSMRGLMALPVRLRA